MAITVKQFVKLLRKSGIVTDEKLGAWLKKNTTDDVKALAKKMIADEIVTRWQAKYLFGGKYKLKFGSYELLERLKQNSVGKEIGSRFLALHKQLDRKVDMLFLSPDLCQESKRLRELIRQVGMMSEVGEHPNLERVYDIDKDEKRYYLITENLDGRPVTQLAENHQLTSVHVADIARQSIIALSYAHEMGVIHGSLTTNDMMLDNHRQLKIRNIVQAFLARNLNQESDLTIVLPNNDWDSLKTLSKKILAELPENHLIGDCEKLSGILDAIDADLVPDEVTQELSNWIKTTSNPTATVESSSNSEVAQENDVEQIDLDVEQNIVTEADAPAIDLGDDSTNPASQSFSGLSSINTGEKTPVESTGDVTPIQNEPTAKSEPLTPTPKPKSRKRKKSSRGDGFGRRFNIPTIVAAAAIPLLLLGVLGYALGFFNSSPDPVAEQDPPARKITPTNLDTSDKSKTTSGPESSPNTPSLNGAAIEDSPADDFPIDEDDFSDELGSIDPAMPKELDTETSLEDQLNNSFAEDLENEPAKNESMGKIAAKAPPVSKAKTTISQPETAGRDAESHLASPLPTPNLPFDDLKPATTLPLANNNSEAVLGTVYPYRNTVLKPTLIWDPKLVRGGTNFEIGKDVSSQKKWNVIGKSKAGEATTIAKLEHRENNLRFKWLPAAKQFNNANYLRNAILQLEFPGQKRKLRLRKPTILDGFTFATDKPEIECEATVDWLPVNVTTTLNELSPDLYGELFVDPESRMIDRRKGLRIAIDSVEEDRLVSIVLKSDVRKKLKLSGKVEIRDEKGRLKTATTERMNQVRDAIEQLLQVKTKERDIYKDTPIAEIRKYFKDDSIKHDDRKTYVKKLEEEMGIAESRLKSIDGYAKRLANFQVRPVPVLVEYELAGEKIVVASTWDTEFVERKIEGEEMEIVSKTKGSTSFQSTKGNKWSGTRQLWWRDAKVGSKLQLEFTMPSSGKFKVVANLTLDRDYGKHKITINGAPSATEIDEYAKFLINRDFDLGTFDLIRGTNTLEVEVSGANSAANPRHMFGLDFLKVESAKE